MRQRVITAVIASVLFAPILIFADYIIMPIAVAACSAIAVFEMQSCIGLKKAISVGAPLYLCAAVIPFLIRYLKNASMIAAISVSAVLGIALYFFAVLIFSHGKYRLEDLGVSYFANLYILFGFNALLYVHDYENGGKYLYLVAFIGAFATDIFAYFCGRLFGKGGKHKLAPDVSPKKTVEGSIGGIIFCVISLVLFGIVVEQINSEINANVLLFAFAGILVSIVAQIGDLSMSVIKRNYGIKDYGKIFPGHGGMLDRVDSVLAVSAVLLIFTMFFNFFH